LRDYGSHIVKRHGEDFFSGQNLKDLHKESALRQPLNLFVGDDQYYFCFADNSCIRKEANADLHFKTRKEKHREAITTLREKYPLNQTSDKTAAVAQDIWTKKQKQDLESDFVDMFSAMTDKSRRHDEVWEFSRKNKALFRSLGICCDYEDLKEKYPQVLGQPEPEEPEEEELPPEEPPDEKEHQETFSFNQNTVIAEKTKTPVLPTMPKQNYLLMKTTEAKPPQLKIISNSKIQRPPTHQS
jgi:predicted nucleic acid-binding protein